jgi:plasmid maintenance system killer protein
VQLSFKTADLREICNDDKRLKRRFGEKGRKKIRQRLDDFAAAENLAVIGCLPGARCEELKGDRAGTFSVRVHDGYRIVFIPDHDPVPRKEDSGVNWSVVTAIRIESIEDYHD